jgi:hypothetical protein
MLQMAQGHVKHTQGVGSKGLCPSTLFPGYSVLSTLPHLRVF